MPLRAPRPSPRPPPQRGRHRVRHRRAHPGRPRAGAAAAAAGVPDHGRRRRRGGHLRGAGERPRAGAAPGRTRCPRPRGRQLPVRDDGAVGARRRRPLRCHAPPWRTPPQAQAGGRLGDRSSWPPTPSTTPCRASCPPTRPFAPTSARSCVRSPRRSSPRPTSTRRRCCGPSCTTPARSAGARSTSSMRQLDLDVGTVAHWAVPHEFTFPVRAEFDLEGGDVRRAAAGRRRATVGGAARAGRLRACAPPGRRLADAMAGGVRGAAAARPGRPVVAGVRMSRRLTPMDTMFLYGETPSSMMHVASLLLFELPERDVGDVRARLRPGGPGDARRSSSPGTSSSSTRG